MKTEGRQLRLSLVSSHYNLHDQERMSRAKNYFAWQARMVRRELGQRVLEVGCGIGNFTAAILDREAVMAIDIDPSCISRLGFRFGKHANLEARVGDVASEEFLALKQFRADSCVALNVLEHIQDDRAVLTRMAAVLEPGGKIVLLVPAFPSLYGPIDRNLGHFRRYTTGSLRQMAESVGLKVSKLHFVNLVGFFGWWWNARIGKIEAQSERQIGIFDRSIVPLLSRAEELLSPPFGQSILAVLRVP